MNPARRISLGLVGTLYLFSGALGLIYEVAFAKYLGFTFGATAGASSAVLVAFMGGLALGAFITGRFEQRVTRPLFLYGIVELAIGGFCAISPFLFELLTPIYVALAARTQSLAVLSAVRGSLAILIVAVPAVGMGTTLPLLARFIHNLFEAASPAQACETKHRSSLGATGTLRAVQSASPGSLS